MLLPCEKLFHGTGLNGIKGLNDYLIDKYGKDDSMNVNAIISNFINWLILIILQRKRWKGWN